MTSSKGNQIAHIRERIVRVIAQYQNGNCATGTGFFISSGGDLLTCFHVVFGSELRNIRTNPVYVSTVGADEHSKLENFFNGVISFIEVEFSNGIKRRAKLKAFDEFHDAVLLELEESFETPFLKLSLDYLPEYDEAVFFCGFQLAAGYLNSKEYPFATNRGIVSSFPEVVVGGEKYVHIQLNSINLGGNSGAPLFLQGEKDVIGIVNGNMLWGNDNLAFVNKIGGVPAFNQGSFRVPLSIAFVTPIKLIKEKTKLLDHIN